MKKFLAALVLFSSMTAFAGEMEVKVSGMVCSLCSQGIMKKLKQEKALSHYHVDMTQKMVHLKTHEGQDLSDEQITKIITEAGYNVAEIKRK